MKKKRILWDWVFAWCKDADPMRFVDDPKSGKSLDEALYKARKTHRFLSSHPGTWCMYSWLED